MNIAFICSVNVFHIHMLNIILVNTDCQLGLQRHTHLRAINRLHLSPTICGKSPPLVMTLHVLIGEIPNQQYVIQHIPAPLRAVLTISYHYT